MPCRDWTVEEEREIERRRSDFFEASLCGIFTFLKNQPVKVLEDVLDNLDYEEMGVTRKELEDWWRAHQREDEKRRKREEAARRKAELKAQALAKLTEEERKALGVK